MASGLWVVAGQWRGGVRGLVELTDRSMLGRALLLVLKCGNLGREVDGGGEPLHSGKQVYADLAFLRGLCVFTTCVSLRVCGREISLDDVELAASVPSGGLAVSDPASFSLSSFPPCSWFGSCLLSAWDVRHLSPTLGHRCGGTAEETEPMPLPSSLIVERLTDSCHSFL